MGNIFNTSNKTKKQNPLILQIYKHNPELELISSHLAEFMNSRSIGVLSLGASNGALERTLCEKLRIPIYAVSSPMQQQNDFSLYFDVADIDISEIPFFMKGKTIDTILISDPTKFDYVKNLAIKYVIYKRADAFQVLRKKY